MGRELYMYINPGACEAHICLVQPQQRPATSELEIHTYSTRLSMALAVKWHIVGGLLRETHWLTLGASQPLTSWYRLLPYT